MKKFKLIALSCLAVFGLASCEAPEFLTKIIPSLKKEAKVTSVAVSGAPESVNDETAPFQLVANVVVENDASKEVTWSTSDVSVATVSESGLVTPVGSGSVTITATSVADSSKSGSVTFTVSVKPAVLSVSIKGAKSEGSLHSTMSLSAEVSVKGNVSKVVTWKSSDDQVATVSSSGVVTFLKEGTVTITATSSVDPSKSASVTIVVVDNGSYPELVEEGYVFAESWPTQQANAWAGISVPGIEEAGEFYYKAFAAVPPTAQSYGSASYFEVLAEDTNENFYGIRDAFAGAGFFYFYDSNNDVYCFIDPSMNVEVDVLVDYLDEDYTESVLCVDVYKTSEIYGSAEGTSDTAWNADVAKVLEAYGIELPFVVLGEEYDVEDYEDGAFEIYDFSPVFTRLDGYGDVLEGAGFVEDEDGYYVKAVDAYRIAYVSLGFGTEGNYIYVELGLKELDSFPSAEVQAYVDSIESINTVPDFAGAAAKFTYEPSVDSKTQSIYAVNVGVLHATQSEISAYITSLVGEGYVLDTESSFECEGGESEYVLQNGKICIDIQLSFYRFATEEEIENFFNLTEEDLNNMTDEEYMNYMTAMFSYLFTGKMEIIDYSSDPEAKMIISSDPKAHELPGLYNVVETLELYVGDTVEANKWFEVFGIESPELVFSSNYGELVSVDESGVISALDVTEQPALVMVTIPETAYEAHVMVSVAEPIPVGATFDFSEIKQTAATVGEFSFTTAVGSNSNKQAAQYNSDKKELRLYIGNTITFSSKETMTSIFFDANSCKEEKADGTLSASVGTISKVDGGYLWEGSATEVTFTVKTGKQFHINTIVINGGGEGGGGSHPVGEDESIEDIISEIAYYIFEDATKYYPDGEGGFYTGAIWGSTSSYTLVSAIEEFAEFYLPESICIELEEPALDTWDDGSEGAFAEYCNEDLSIIVDVGTYVSGTDIILQVNVYSL